MRILLRTTNCCVCNSPVHLFFEEEDNNWYECENCGFLQKAINPELLKQFLIHDKNSKGYGEDSGYREYWFASELNKRFGLKKILLVGTGLSWALEKLLKEEMDGEEIYYGCDINPFIIKKKMELYGENRFFDCNKNLPKSFKFDGLIFIEVFEHLPYPLLTMQYYLKYLSENNAAIVISTDFYPEGNYGGLIPRMEYARSNTHISYWSEKSFRKLADKLQLKTIFFDMKYGSIYSNDKTKIDYDAKFPNRRVCVLCNNEELFKEFGEFKTKCQILPIDRL